MKILVWPLTSPILISMISTTPWRSYNNLLTLRWWKMIPFLACSCQHHKGGVPFYVMLLPNVMKKCSPPTQIWIHTQLTEKQSLIVQFAPLWGEMDMPHWYLTSLSHAWSPTSCGIICFAFYILFCKGLKMMGVTRFTQPHVHIRLVQ
jgi:hypothetical protein